MTWHGGTGSSLLWLLGGVLVFAFVAYQTKDSRREWWRPLLLSFLAVAALLQIPLVGPDDAIFMPIVLLLLSGCSLPLLAVFLFFVVFGWGVALLFRRYGLEPEPEAASEGEEALADYPLTKDGDR